MAIVGYARVSSVGQSLDVQLDKLQDCDKIFQEKQLTQQQCSELRQKRADGVLIKTLMQDYNLSKASVYRYLDKSKST